MYKFVHESFTYVDYVCRWWCRCKLFHFFSSPIHLLLRKIIISYDKKPLSSKNFESSLKGNWKNDEVTQKYIEKKKKNWMYWISSLFPFFWNWRWKIETERDKWQKERVMNWKFLLFSLVTEGIMITTRSCTGCKKGEFHLKLTPDI